VSRQWARLLQGWEGRREPWCGRSYLSHPFHPSKLTAFSTFSSSGRRLHRRCSPIALLRPSCLSLSYSRPSRPLFSASNRRLFCLSPRLRYIVSALAPSTWASSFPLPHPPTIQCTTPTSNTFRLSRRSGLTKPNSSLFVSRETTLKIRHVGGAERGGVEVRCLSTSNLTVFELALTAGVYSPLPSPSLRPPPSPPFTLLDTFIRCSVCSVFALAICVNFASTFNSTVRFSPFLSSLSPP
jgi:hypothetical protein